MSRRFLGESIDIHCGGKDLIFPHHENEVAQSECCSGKTFVKYWMHNGYINVDNQKMSKSLGNFFTVRDAAEKFGYMPIRFFLLSAHYRMPVNFSADTLAAAKSSLERLTNCAETVSFYLKNAPAGAVSGEIEARLAEHKAKFIEVMDDDFNTADGVTVLFELASDIFAWTSSGVSKGSAEAASALFNELCSLMGFIEEKSDDAELIKYVEEQIELRNQAKKEKNFAEADRIRDELAAKGILIKDTRQGTTYTINN
jgi:cysteinyl-tRNA synthetase